MPSPLSPCSVSVSSSSSCLRLRRRAAAHDRPRQLALERRLGLGHERLGLLAAPGRVVAVRLAVPLLEVDRPRFLDELPVLVVDPVARERARSGQLVLGRAVGLDRERERRPGDRRADPHERLAAHASWRRGARASARRLLEAHPAVTDLGLALDRRQRDGGDAQLLRADLDPRHAEVTRPEMAGVRDRAVVCRPRCTPAARWPRGTHRLRASHRGPRSRPAAGRRSGRRPS